MSLDFLPVPTVARHLGIEDAAVKRLIAKGSLTAQPLPQGGYLVDSGSLNAYVASGMPGITAPQNDGAWYTGADVTYLAGLFQASIANELANQLPKDRPTADLQIQAKITDALRQIITAQPRQCPGRIVFSPDDPRWIDTRFVYLVAHLRDTAAPIVIRQMSKLFKSPVDYRKITGQALVAMKSKAITAKKSWPNPDYTKADITATVVLSHAVLLPDSIVRSLFDVAF